VGHVILLSTSIPKTFQKVGEVPFALRVGGHSPVESELNVKIRPFFWSGGRQQVVVGGRQKSEALAFTSQSEISRIGALSFLWCSFRVKRIAFISSVLVTIELAKAESKPRDLSKNGHQRSAHLGASGNLVPTSSHSISLGFF